MSEDAPGIDWSTAEVADGRLEVALGGRRSSAWAERLEQVLERLDRGGHHWGEIEIAKKKLRVDAVEPGAEEDLRHFLESAVLQANTDVPPKERKQSGGERSDADRQMTDVFRSFAER
jgi:hypothetical protein